jgi:hypothetical protein
MKRLYVDQIFIDLQKVSILGAIYLYQIQCIYVCISGTPLPAQGTHVRLEKLTYAVTGACNVSLLMRRGNPVRQK